LQACPGLLFRDQGVMTWHCMCFEKNPVTYRYDDMLRTDGSLPTPTGSVVHELSSKTRGLPLFVLLHCPLALSATVAEMRMGMAIRSPSCIRRSTYTRKRYGRIRDYVLNMLFSSSASSKTVRLSTGSRLSCDADQPGI
jgi:hypothetical protein